MFYRGILLFAVFGMLSVGGFSQSFQKAEMLLDHGLTHEAQTELIDVVFSANPALAKDKPKALGILASIAIDKNNISAAVKTWNKLIKEYPASPEATQAKDRLPLLKSILGKAADESIDNATAKVYFRSADFWSDDRDKIFKIDPSWIPEVEAAVYWYDKIITEFPNSISARIAYEEKLRTLIGWKSPGRDGEAVGAKGDIKYLPTLESTFRAYETSFPDANAAQGFRFIIAQAFWGKRNWSKTREWLNEIIQKDGNDNSFYKDLAQRRLQKVEY
jgi:hypothetical protein